MRIRTAKQVPTNNKLHQMMRNSCCNLEVRYSQNLKIDMRDEKAHIQGKNIS